MTMSNIADEREKDIKESILAVRKDILVIEKELSEIIETWRDDYTETREILGQIRMLFVKDIRLVDKLDSNVFYEEKVESVGFRSQTLGGSNRDVTKSYENNIITRILKGEIKDVRKAVEPFRPKDAKNE